MHPFEVQPEPTAECKRMRPKIRRTFCKNSAVETGWFRMERLPKVKKFKFLKAFLGDQKYWMSPRLFVESYYNLPMANDKKDKDKIASLVSLSAKPRRCRRGGRERGRIKAAPTTELKRVYATLYNPAAGQRPAPYSFASHAFFSRSVALRQRLQLLRQACRLWLRPRQEILEASRVQQVSSR